MFEYVTVFSIGKGDETICMEDVFMKYRCPQW